MQRTPLTVPAAAPAAAVSAMYGYFPWTANMQLFPHESYELTSDGNMRYFPSATHMHTGQSPSALPMVFWEALRAEVVCGG